MYRDFVAVVADLAAKYSLPVVATIPDDIAHVPCVVVGRVQSSPAEAAMVFDLSLELYLIGRRQRADDPLGLDGHLLTDLDGLADTFGGTRGITYQSWHLALTDVLPTVVSIAGLEYEAYQMTIESSTSTCTT